MEQQISNNVLRQLLLLTCILILTGLILWNLSVFLPSLLGAVTLYIVCREYNFYLIEKKKWKPWLSSLFLILVSLVVFILPFYFVIDLLFDQFKDAQVYVEQMKGFLEKIHQFIYSRTKIDVLNEDNIGKITTYVGAFSTTIVTFTVNIFTVVTSMYFLLYFMFANPRLFERIVTRSLPLKRANINLLGERFRKLVVANAVGIPVVAFGQGIVALIGYWIFGVPNALLLFALTAISSMLPIVGAGIVFVPVGLYMIAEGNTFGGVGLLVYCTLVVGLTDNLLRFTLLKKMEDIHPLNTVFGIVMGMNLFGFMGLIFGPILVSITLLLMQVYQDEFSDDEITQTLSE